MLLPQLNCFQFQSQRQPAALVPILWLGKLGNFLNFTHMIAWRCRLRKTPSETCVQVETAVVVALHWQAFVALFGFAPPSFAMVPKAEALPWIYIASVLGLTRDRLHG